MLLKRIDLNSWGITDLELLFKHYGIKKIGSKTFLLLSIQINVEEFFNFKLQKILN